MKKIVFYILFVSFVHSTFAQSDSFKTNIETAVNTKGFLLKQDIFVLEDFGKFRIGAVKITNLENFSITSGAKIIHIIQEGKTFKSNYTEIKFATKSGFLVQLSTILNTANNLDWSFSIQTNVAVEKSYIVYTTADIDKLQKVLEQIKSKL